MKTIEFEGKQYEVPDWFNWVAMDEDQKVYGYSKEPYLRGSLWDMGGAMYEIHIPEMSWQKSLTKV